jgi:hypothetical protein
MSSCASPGATGDASAIGFLFDLVEREAGEFSGACQTFNNSLTGDRGRGPWLAWMSLWNEGLSSLAGQMTAFW